ncbi:PD-(D/E)XK nuclease family protein [Mucisphaera calidilacus]|uniref:ATP-dependent helicase/deoxyribonuclease subunit B n=1 Tax=Mucisphaera calidilacus TaxID=2527982 RepID=A0A518BYM9_9BACT|nr:PD-(D/E)XK nuclease family protein [Mucisphaera calidilacus]QDU72075.1 ATP-dependent helicase/deoxyribonuclease subunit B [Mucisphaera calidilacus]
MREDVAMPARRIFLGQGQPLLDLAVAAIARAYPAGDVSTPAWDLTGVLIAIPSDRARRQLLDRLVARAEADGRVLLPPELTAPERLMRLAVPNDPTLATPWQSLLVRRSVLERVDPAAIEALIPNAASVSGAAGESLVTWMMRTSDELLLEGLAAETLPDRLREAGVDIPSMARYEAFALLERAYLEALERLGLKDRWRHVAGCVERGEVRVEREILLLGVMSPQRLLQRLLRCVSDRVTALVGAPEGDAEAFDDLGVAVGEVWAGRSPTLDDACLRFVERATDQNVAVVEAIEGHTRGAGYDAGDVAVVTTSPTLSEPIRAAITMAGTSAAVIGSMPLEQTPPATLLGLLIRFAESRRLDDLAVLLRHPDALLYLRHCGLASAPPPDVVGVLDRVASEAVIGEIDASWLRGQAEALGPLVEALLALLPGDLERPRLLCGWAGVIRSALEGLYNHEGHAKEALPLLGESLEVLLEQIDAVSQLAGGVVEQPELSLEEAWGWLLDAASASVGLPVDESALAIVGVLELAFDPSPVLVVAGLNEGQFPARPRPDRLLPESLRVRLGIDTATRRCARDLWALGTAIGSRDRVTLIATGRSAEDDPLLPSLPLLGGDRATQIARLQRFLTRRDAAAERLQVIEPGKANRFLMACPPASVAVPERVSVTAFRDYISCPYRFYLKHVRRLRVSGDAAYELDAAGFGTLMHEVLATLKDVDPADRSSEARIGLWLDEALDRCARARMGAVLSPTLRLQVMQARERLAPVAAMQHARWEQGWEIVAVEESLRLPVAVGGRTMTIKGKIDRIDRHPDGGWQVLDYKTFDNVDDPRKKHWRSSVETWIDLQLPIYLDLVRQEPVAAAGDIDTGYWVLPAKPSADTNDHIVLCGWNDEEIKSARAERDRILEAIASGIFWPPSDQARYEDGYEALCADYATDREDLIETAREEVS